MSTEIPTARVGGLPFAIQPLDSAVQTITERAAAKSSTAVHFANAYTVALARKHPEYARLFQSPGSLVYSDGTPVTWIGRRGYPSLADRWQRVYGPDVMTSLLRAEASDGLSHYFLGGSPRTLDRLVTEVARRWPGAKVVGYESPPFKPLTAEQEEAQITRIAASGANLVWVGLGTPKQDFAVARIANTLPVVALGVGAAFDFLAGTKRQAPVWMQRSGTEWLYRLASEPRRLWHRYAWGNPQFLLAAAQEPGLRRGRAQQPPNQWGEQ